MRRVTGVATLRHLYFDIDGTVLREDRRQVKPALENGRFQQLVERGGFDRVLCVSNMIQTIDLARAAGATVDGLEIVYRYCDGAFSDETWVRERVRLIADPENRVEAVDFASDWWYVDDLAAYYFRQAGRSSVYREQLGRRVCEPSNCGDGQDVAAWLESVVAGSRPTRSD